ncbi:MAG: hypothetical protein OJF47_002023 [Nitrospira sp.]|nr:MAG: hypothetical protein OJF47_002023 [Nitrospira sp.]
MRQGAGKKMLNVHSGRDGGPFSIRTQNPARRILQRSHLANKPAEYFDDEPGCRNPLNTTILSTALSDREMEILRLNLSIKTVSTCRTRLLTKLGT